MLSNLVFLPIDREIKELLDKKWSFIKYSRYADDLAFSSKKRYPFKRFGKLSMR
jgi:hypothetical protein